VSAARVTIGVCAVLAVTAAPGVGCSRAAEGRPAPAGSASAAPRGTLVLGEPVGSLLTSLADIAKSPALYENKVVTTSGKVTAVCQEMGCWMELRDESGQAHVRMHGHAFFVPKTASGHSARVQARVLRGSDDQCAESPPPERATSKVELDATGVELD
jgi:hypothetical protein